MKLRRVAPIAVLLALAGCETTNSSDWSGGQGTPFKQAERSCNELLPTVAKEESRREGEGCEDEGEGFHLATGR